MATTYPYGMRGFPAKGGGLGGLPQPPPPPQPYVRPPLITHTPVPWVRPADWLALPTVNPGDQKLVGLFPVYDADSNYIAILVSGDYTVDWGDGTVENFGASVKAVHNYVYASIPAGTLSVRGYRQVVVTVTPQIGQSLTSIDLTADPFSPSLNLLDIPWLDVALGSSVLSTLRFYNIVTNFNLSKMERITIVDNGTIADFSNMFQLCSSLQEVSLILNNCVTCADMFKDCPSLQIVSLFNTASVTNFNNMFNGCPSLQTVPLFNTASATNFSNMFASCSSLQTVPLFNTASAIDFNYMFSNCVSLQTVPLFNTASVTTFDGMFTGCVSLQTVPLFNTASVTNFTNMFANCASLQTVPLFNTASATTFNNMFTGCVSLQTVPLFNTASATNFGGMFYGCSSLQTVPLFNTASVTNFTSMLASCVSLQTVPLFNTASATTFNSMFSNCVSLQTVPLFNTASATDFGNMFSSCSSLQTVPLFNTASVTNFTFMFYGCPSLQTVPLFNTASAIDFSNVFANCASLQTVPLFNLSSALWTNGVFDNCKALRAGALFNVTTPMGYTGCVNLSKAALETIFENLGSPIGPTTITVSGSIGSVPSPFSPVGTAQTTAGSTTVLMSLTSGLEAGMLVTGVGINDARAVTFQTGVNTVTLNAHGIADGTPVSFSAITTTAGIVIYKKYFVVNSTLNTFQVSNTLGGAPESLTLDGTGYLLYGTFVQSVAFNTSITVTIPASADSSLSLAFTKLDTSIASLKNWTVLW
jgi:surface protein